MTIQILFYIFAILAVLAGANVIISRNPVRAVLSLVFCFVATAVLWLLLEAEFLALVLIVVYVGAVMVLFLFVVMMLDIKTATRKASFVLYWPVAGICGILILLMLIRVLGPNTFGLEHVPPPSSLPLDYSSIKALGYALFTDYVYPFELAAVLLLAAMVAAITLTHRGRRGGAKVQKAAEQIHVKAKDRLTVVKMPAGKPDSTTPGAAP